MAPSSPQRSFDFSKSLSFSAASEPAKSAPPDRKAVRPPPDPTGSYWTVASGLVTWKPTVQACMAAACDVAPDPTSVPLTGFIGAVVPEPPAVVVDPPFVVVVPPAVVVAPPVVAAPAATVVSLELSSSSPHAAR